MTLEQFVKAARNGEIEIPGSIVDGSRIVEGLVNLSVDNESITAEAYERGLLSYNIKWEDGLEKVSMIL